MQRADLDALAQLFDLASDGTDESLWAQHFQDHIAQAMRSHGIKLRAGGGVLEQRLELLRARLELQEIVADRLEFRAARVDPGLAQALRELRAASAPLIQEALDPALHRVALGTEATLAARTASAHTVGPAAGFGAIRREGSEDLQVLLGKTKLGGPGDLGACKKRGEPTMYSKAPGLLQPQPMRKTPGPAVAPLPLADISRQIDTVRSQGSAPRAVPLVSPRDRDRGNGYALIHDVRRNKERCLVAGAGRPGKEITLRQLRSIIASVCASKVQQDRRCVELHEPLETMEQHLYSYFSRRYGHKSIVEEWAQAVLHATQRWAPRECDVQVFDKILRNTLAESFATVQETLRSTVQTLLRSNMQQRTQASPAESEELWRGWVRHGVPLRECEAVVRYMYNERDSDRVMEQLGTLSTDAPGAGTSAASAATREPAALVNAAVDAVEVLRYKDFLQTLLTFQMNLTEAFLADFGCMFSEVDADNIGVLSTPQLLELGRRLATLDPDVLPRVEAASQAALAEAHVAAQAAARSLPCGRATFSECVELFTRLIAARWAAHETTASIMGAEASGPAFLSPKGAATATCASDS